MANGVNYKVTPKTNIFNKVINRVLRIKLQIIADAQLVVGNWKALLLNVIISSKNEYR